MAEALVGIGLDLEAVERQLAALSGMTGAEVTRGLARIERLAARSAAKIAAATKAEMKGQRDAQRAAEAAAKAAERAAEQQARATLDGLRGLGKASGLLSERMEQAAQGASLIVSPAGAAAVAVAAIAAAAAGAVLAVGALAVGVVQVVRSASGLARALAPFEQIAGFEGIPAAALASIDRATAGLDALQRIGERVVVALGAELAPALERVTLVAVELGLAGLDLAQAWLRTHDVLVTVGRAVGAGLVTALTAPILPLAQLVDALVLGARSLGLDLPESAQHTADALTRLSVEAGERLADDAMGSLSAALDSAGIGLGDYEDRARALIGTQAELTARTRDRARAHTEERDALRAAEAAQRAYHDALSEVAGTLVEATDTDRLRAMRDELVAAALGADATTESLARTAAMVDQLDARIAGLAYDAQRALDLPGEQMQAAMDAAIEESERGADELQRIIAQIPWDIAIYDRLFTVTEQAVSRAREILSSLTGGALGLGIGDLLKEATKGAGGADAMADSAVSFITSLARNIGPFIEEFAARMPEIATALANATPKIIAALINALPDVVVGLARAFANLGVILGKAIWQTVKDAIREIGTLGQAKTKTYGDTPGPVRIQSAGQSARFAAGDLVVAARDRRGLEDQIGIRAQPQAVTVRLDVRDGPVALGVAVATSRAVARQGLGRDTSGRRSPYR